MIFGGKRNAFFRTRDVRYWPLADITFDAINVRFQG